MSALSNAPALTRGAIVTIDPITNAATTTIFQYNPGEMTRSLTTQGAVAEGDRSEALRLKGPPIETINMKVEIDATDQLASSQSLAMSSGIYPQLSALEIMIYPKSAQVLANELILLLGGMEIVPTLAPLTLLVWGASRSLPVRITELNITETDHDAALNPIRAEVTLGLRVLTYEDVTVDSQIFHMSLANQILKETMAALNVTTN